MIVAGNDKLFAALCEVLGVPELTADPRFLTNPDRVANRPELLALLEERTRERSSAELLEALVAAGVPASPVHDVGEAARHPQTEALGILQSLGDFVTVAAPLSADGERVRHHGAAAGVSARTPGRSSASSATPRTRSRGSPRRASSGSADGTRTARRRTRPRAPRPSPSSPPA